MAQSYNPFDIIELRLTSIESLLIELKHELNYQPSTQSDQWFDLSALCNYLPDQPTNATVYSWVHKGLIPCHKGGKKLRFLKSEIDNWLMEGRKKTLNEIAKEADAYLSECKNKNLKGKAPPHM